MLATRKENKMSYRKIEVDGQIFEYSIGKTHTKIRGVGAYENEKVGYRRVSSECNWWDTPEGTLQVRPGDVAAFIRQNKREVKQ
jgi:hypothetical protein